LGSPPLKAFYKVILPEISPGIVTGAMLAFTLSVDDFVVSFFTTGSGVTNLSIMIFSMARRGVNPKINALSTIIFIVVLVLLYMINRRDLRNSKKKEAYNA
jgi:spermidine/putrescine transport system permease protein